MTFKRWLKAKGFAAGELTEQQTGVLRAMWERQYRPAAPDLEAPRKNHHVAELQDSSRFAENTFRTTKDGTLYARISVPDDVNVMWAKLKGRARPKDMPLAVAVLFPAGKWSIARARKWLEANSIKFQTLHPASKGGAGKKPAKATRAAGRQDLAPTEGPADLQLVCEAPLEITAADPDGQDKLPTFELLAYTGGLLKLVGWLYQVVIDLQGMKISKRPRPVLLEHDRSAIVGHTTTVEKQDSKLRVTGVVSGTGAAAQEVVDASKNGFPWQVSIGARNEQMCFIQPGTTARANGRDFKGPVYIARKSWLGEISFVAIGADDSTTAKLAASGAGDRRIEVTDMDFTAWLTAKGFEVDKLTDEQLTFLKAAWKADAEPAADAGAGTGTPDAGAHDQVRTEDEVRTEAITAERDRRKTIEAACKGFDGERIDQLREQALNGDIELQDLRASLLDYMRTQRTTPTLTAERRDSGRKMLLAAAYLAGRLPEDRIITFCGEPAIEAAHKFRGLGLQEFCARCASLDGVELGRFQAGPSEWLHAAFSTMSLPSILANVANKGLLEGYNYVEDTWRQVVKIASVQNFLQHTRYRLTGDMKYVKVAGDGEIKHGALGEQEYTQQADTFAIMFSLTRQSIINDDLSAFMAIPQMLGMGAGEAVAEAVWTLLLSNPSSFFHADNSNYLTGAGTALSVDSLTTAEALFLDQTKPNGRPLGISPKRLAVPTGLKVTAEQLMSSLKLRDTTASRKTPTDNPHAGKFTIACSAYLANAVITGNSATAWYLFADPNVLAALEVAFLNGVDRPTVERAEADFNTLGIQMRGYVDFGVKEQDPRGACKMDGA